MDLHNIINTMGNLNINEPSCASSQPKSACSQKLSNQNFEGVLDQIRSINLQIINQSNVLCDMYTHALSDPNLKNDEKLLLLTSFNQIMENAEKFTDEAEMFIKTLDTIKSQYSK